MASTRDQVEVSIQAPVGALIPAQGAVSIRGLAVASTQDQAGGLYTGPGGGMYSGPSQYCSNIPPWSVFAEYLERSGRKTEADLIRSRTR